MAWAHLRACPVLLAVLLFRAAGCAMSAGSAGEDGLSMIRTCRGMDRGGPGPRTRHMGGILQRVDGFGGVVGGGGGEDEAVAGTARSKFGEMRLRTQEGASRSGFRASSMMSLALRGGAGEETAASLPPPLGLNETMIEMLRKMGREQGDGSRIAVNQTILDMLQEMGPQNEEDDNTTIADKMTSWEGKMVSVEVDQGFEMRGKLVHLDDGMNAMLAGPIERYDVESGEHLGTDVEDILVKGSNVIHVALMEGMIEVEQDADE